jgi:hypothetical protein
MKLIAVDLAKSVYQIAESVRFGQVVQRKRLNREAFRRYIQEQAEPVEWVMDACGTAHYWGRLAQSLGHQVKLLHPRYVRPYRLLFLPLAWWTSSALSTLRGGYFSVGWMTLFSSTVGRGCPGYLLGTAFCAGRIIHMHS